MIRFRQILCLCLALALPAGGVTEVVERIHCDLMATATPSAAPTLAVQQETHPAQQDEGGPAAGHAVDCTTLHCLASGSGAALHPRAIAVGALAPADPVGFELIRRPTDPAPQDNLRPPIHG